MAESLQSRLMHFLTAIGAFWRWWCGEVAAMLPASVRGAMTSGVAVVAIDYAEDEVTLSRFADGAVSQIARLPRAALDAAGLRAALAPFLSRPWFLRDSFALRLPDAMALRRTVSLPLAARGDLANVLEIELDRQSPLDRQEVYHDYRVASVDRSARRIDVVWRIVRRKSVAPALDLCRKAGIPLAIVAFIGDEAPADGGDLPIGKSAALLLRLRRWLVRGLLLLAVALLVAIAALSYSRNQEAAAAFAARVDVARAQALQSLRLDREIGAVRTRMTLLLRERNRPSVTSVLAETSRLLPQGSWLTDFTYRDGTVHIRGYSNAAASLIGLFDASPLFKSAEFDAPLVQAQSRNLEQFDLKFRLRGDGQ